MHTAVRIAAGLAVAAASALGSSALTGSGLSTTGQAAAPQFIGGQVTQSVSGATLTDVTYGFVPGGTNTAINSATLTFAADADGRTVTLALTGGNTTTFTCSTVAAVTHKSTCTADNSGAETGATSAAITVS